MTSAISFFCCSWHLPIELSSNTAIRDAIAKEDHQNKIDVLLDCAGYEQPFNDAILTMTSNATGRVVVMAVHAKDGLFLALSLRAFYTKALTLKGNNLAAVDVQAFLDALAAEERRPSTLSISEYAGGDALTAALKEVLTRSSHVRSAIVP